MIGARDAVGDEAMRLEGVGTRQRDDAFGRVDEGREVVVVWGRGEIAVLMNWVRKMKGGDEGAGTVELVWCCREGYDSSVINQSSILEIKSVE